MKTWDEALGKGSTQKNRLAESATAKASAEHAGLTPPRTPQIPPEIVPMRARQARQVRTFKALNHRNFQLYLAGQLVSLAGTWMQIIAQGWLVYQISGSEATLGIVGFAAAIPVLVISPWAGVVIDRVPKRTLLITTQSTAMLLAFILAALTFTGLVQVWQIVLLAMGLGAVNAFDGPARQAFVVEMVGRDDMPNAIALNSMTFNMARIVGPAIGGILLATVGSAWCFTFNGFSFMAVIFSLFAMRIQYRPPKQEQASPWQQLKSGLHYAGSQPELRGLLLVALFFSIFGISYSTVLPAFIDRVLNAGAATFGMLTAATGIGAVSGAFLLATFSDGGQRGRWLFTAALIYPVVLFIFAFNQNIVLALALSFVLGIGFMLQFTLINTLLQTNVADTMRGRVLSLYTLTIFGFAPIGNLMVGTVAELIGLSLALALSATISLLAAATIFWRTPQLRQLP